MIHYGYPEPQGSAGKGPHATAPPSLTALRPTTYRNAFLLRRFYAKQEECPVSASPILLFLMSAVVIINVYLGQHSKARPEAFYAVAALMLFAALLTVSCC